MPTDCKQLWLGDYVDRGHFGAEVLLLLVAAKIKWPACMYLLRGNHESRAQTHKSTFESECVSKYGAAVYDACCELFDALPLAAVVTSGHGRYFAVHGGLSPFIRSPVDLERIERFEEPPLFGPACDLLWSDPLDESAVDASSPDALRAFQEEYYTDNTGRGCGQLFGPQAARDFLVDNELVCVLRAHEVQKDGAKWGGMRTQIGADGRLQGYRAHRFLDSTRPVPMVVTLFSAPNYWLVEACTCALASPLTTPPPVVRTRTWGRSCTWPTRRWTSSAASTRLRGRSRRAPWWAAIC